jgi:predicted RNA-binding Zn ribbon-like protein
MVMTKAAAPTAFQLSGGHPALDFVNTLDNRFSRDGPVELLESYADLLEFLQQSGLLNVQQARLLDSAATKGAAARVLQSARELREAMAAVLYGTLEGRAPRAAHLRTLENHFLLASRHRRLRWRLPSKQSAARAGAIWTWGRFETDVELPVWMLAQSAAGLMTSSALEQLRACGSDTCRWLFLDTSKNHTRRWCDMKICGNRMKARRFSARRQA